MKIIGNIPGYGRSFEEMLEGIQTNTSWYLKLLNTIHSSKYFTNNILVSKLNAEENEVISVLSSKRDNLSSIEPLDFAKVLPKKLSSLVKSAEYLGKGANYYL